MQLKRKAKLPTVIGLTTKIEIRFSKALGEIIGLNPDLSNQLVGNDNQVFAYAVDLNMTYHQMFIYSDVADYTYDGNITAPILIIISYKQSNLALSRIKTV